MIKVKDGYAKLIGTTYQGSATQVLLSNGGDLEYSASSKASTLVQRNASQHIYATYFNSAISDEALTDIGSVYVRNTSDTFIRRVSKTQFYSILDDKFVTLDTTQSITGAKTFSTSVRFANNASIIQNQNDTSNYTTILKWYKNGASRNTYDPSIGQHNTGGDGNGSICILPYPTETSPWGGMVGLFISKGVLKLDGKSVALAENYYTKTESDERYVNVTGDTMTGPLIVKAAITGTQLISTIATGTSPLKVTSTTVVTNLNSDLLDGLHETSFFRARGDQSIASSVPTTTELATSNNLCGSWNVKYTGASGHLVQFNTGSGSTRYMQFYSMYSGSLYWRNSTDSTLNTKSWKTIVDSANYTGIVLKIGTATKGSATLPIYLNAGTPTACSTTLGVSITGNAATATTAQYLASNSRMDYGWNGLNYFNINGTAGTAVKANNTPTTAWWHILRFNHANSSGYYTDLAVPFNANSLYYKRVAAGALANGKWVTILDELNYTSYVNPANFVTSLGTNGNYVTWTKNGTTNNLTVPFATTSNVLNSLGNRTAISGTTVGQSGLRLYEVYNNGYPVNFGNVLNIGGRGYGELLFQWTGDSNPGHLYYRSKRDVASWAWSKWVTILDELNYTSYVNPANFVTSLGTNGNYVTWTKNGTTNNLTVPFATTSNVLNSLGNRTAISGTTVGQSGLRLYEVYNNGYPVNFGNVLNIGGRGYGELLFQWTGDSNPGHLYYRSKRDVASQAWSKWVTILDNNNYSSTLDGRYVTLATNQTVSGIKTFSTQQKFTVATGTSPFTVSSTTVVSNLNADMLDGWHLNYILKDGYVTSNTAGLSSYWRKVWDITLNNQYNDVDINLLVHSAYNQQWGIISFRLRQNGTGTAKNISAYLAEVVGNIPTDRFRLYYNNSSGLCQLWCNPSSQYSVYNYRVLAKTWRIGTEATTLGTFYTGNTTTAQSLPSDSYVSMTGITIVNTAAKVANTLTFAAGAFAAKTYNGSAAVTVNIPTHTSHLTNNSGFWTGTRYWANIAVSTASSTSTQPTFNTCYTSNWFRSTGSTGWYSQTYGGGWYMTDSTWIRTYGSKSVYQNTGQIRTDGYLVTNGGITVGATSPNNGTYKSHVTGNSWSSGYIRAGAGFYHNSVNSNSYVLLAGGSYKSLADFAKGNAGASNRGVYVTNGTVTAMTYYLNATVNSGASGKLAYYSGTNSIDDYTNTIGSSSTPIYINNGIPNAANSYKVVNSGHYFSAFGISGYIYVIRYGQVVCVSINMSSGGNGSTGTTTLLTNLPSAVYTTGQSASKGGGSALRQATFYVSGTTLYVYSYQADQLPNKVSFTYITNTLE